MKPGYQDWRRLMHGLRPIEMFRLYQDPIWVDIHRHSYPRKKWRGLYTWAPLKRAKTGVEWCAR